jgi:hypothetical protein
MKQGGVGWYPNSHFIHIDSGPIRSWELDGTNFDRMLSSGGPLPDLLKPTPPGHIPSVRERLLRSRALARHEFLLRKQRKTSP